MQNTTRAFSVIFAVNGKCTLTACGIIILVLF